ncbi:calmodulin-binding transcription activator 3 isoform X2 [Nymphaea colorata]|uniref:calmodulin-binding transcription activator 3 isoform X2 n=1 Tax=Nymphaea colorata TaxID=210225 RepID=UPI00129ECF43|nr:calmodulin-binding transcription activator 3 isoform X2 [Nymphaea colorata]
MAEGRRYGISSRLDIEQILLEAQHRWLRPAEVCEILRNYRKFQIAPDPPNKPPSGSLFLFDRKVLRYFRKDGHNWRKKKDGKTVREAHERLKAGSVDVLHCYYAHGEENENFQRRSYWMLEEEFEHIVLVHYREVKSNKTSLSRVNGVERNSLSVEMASPACSSTLLPDQSSLQCQSTSTSCQSTGQALEYEDAESSDPQVTSRYNSHFELQNSEDKSFLAQEMPSTLHDYLNVQTSHGRGNDGKQLNIIQSSFSLAEQSLSSNNQNPGSGIGFDDSKKHIDLTSWENVLKQCTVDFQNVPHQARPLSGHSFGVGETPNRYVQPNFEQLFTDELRKQVDGNKLDDGSAWQEHKDLVDAANMEANSISSTKVVDYPAEGDGLKKLDSFCRWMSKEFGDVDESLVPSDSGIYWNVEEESRDVSADSELLSPSLSQEQLFSILDFSPNWVYSGMEAKVLISGTFLHDQDSYKWSCMFGEIEVPAEVIAPGVLRCHAPIHKVGRVPFYITCSNRLSCSEVREFEFRANNISVDIAPGLLDGENVMLLRMRLARFLSSGLDTQLNNPGIHSGKLNICTKINSLLKDNGDEWLQLKNLAGDVGSPGRVKDQLVQQLMKEKLHNWLLVKALEDGKGPNVLDKEGQGVLHLASALGYDWAIAPMIAAGVNVNFRDIRGWTALHWAAFCGRERTVVALVTMGGAPGALTDPTPQFPSGRTPADLASGNGHKGIAGYLAESALTSHLSTLTLKETLQDGHGSAGSGKRDTITFFDSGMTHLNEGGLEDESSLKDSLTAVRNAAQAAARIHQVFRVQSFHRKKLIEYGDDKCGISDEQALSLISFKGQRTGQDEPVHFAAIRIQKKFRGWKGRKEFLIIRQRIVKIQAHVRGHQVRKHLRKIVWSVGIVEKAILRWRRKGIGLRGFRSEGCIDGPPMQSHLSKKDDDGDFLREARRQTEARMEKALARVKSMVQYPEARDQYRRLLTAVTEFEESKVEIERLINGAESIEIDDLVIVETPEDDDISML